MPTLTAEQAEWVKRNASHVRVIARMVRRIVPDTQIDDLESAGNEGLVQAALRYDPESGVTFATFAHYRIRGAMLDWVRRQNPGLRRHQRAVKSLEATQSILEDASQAHAGSRRALEDRVAAARALVEKTAASMMTARAMDNDPDRVAVDESPEHAAIHAQMRHRLAAVLQLLEPDERELIDAIYQRGESMGEMAQRLGVVKSTISRRHARLMAQLAKRLKS